MTNDPLYPTLSPEGEAEAQLIMDKFKERMKKIANEALGELYTNVPDWICTDSWTNYRNTMLEGFQGYKQYSEAHPYDFAKLRKTIYEHNKEEIIKDLNQDLVKENEDLKEQIRWMQKHRC
jgi:hypothetical protein